ncbi:MAG: Amidohydrolase 3 [Candidatus Moranbacteria bacterium GW2011_GWC2_45_10]|nr:MAG: Amidohydrolase 3 [Candidatus Moranbacteria bacterium GW2011_GWC2_45_10]
MYDILIKNGTIVDGTGNPMYKGDVGIKDGLIKEIGDLHNENAEKIIDALGKLVVPGFVDVNNHSDTYWRIFIDPNLESLLHQGITTIVGGNCGSSLAPLVNKDIIKSIQKWVDIKGVNLNWLSVGEFLDEIERRKLPVNFATLVGHGTLRRGIIQDEVRDLTSSEIDMMEKMLKDAMKDGAIGFSTGLVYTHAKRASQDEIMRLAEVVKKYEGVYTTHVRGESGELIDAVEEAVNIAQKTGVKLQVSHLKAMGERHWHLMEEAVNLIETARMSGLDINFDVYPYTATGSVLYILLPDWVAEGGKKLMLQRLKDPDIRARAIKEMKEDAFDYSKIVISISPLDKTLRKKSIAEIAKSQGKGIEEAIIDTLIASEGRVVTMMEVLSEKNVKNAIQNPFSIISSNGSGYSIDHQQTGELVHPRNFGSFPRVLAKYVRAKSLLSWEEAIRKMSGLPAEKFGIRKRGIIKVDNFADIVVFDKNNVEDLSTTDNPYQYSKGIDWVVINGKVVIDETRLTEARPGAVLRRESKSIFEF